ncbi:O-antigen ligase family protein [Gaoshiqia sediminis]|uniref:O-antigen ligase family protein n=1 Tax=Gaoshiqia sediminis TaxID=2986998 RepID=A0AA41Y9A5_9BACT|nr:O-antigen ligase family protein [Gaoshiqia sediminis]MCW0483607.1 O-antigen ligase family protein [Gaoshiqia sediminis]
MPERSHIIWFYSVSALFLLVNFYFLTTKETLLAALLPVVFVFVWLAVARLDWLLLAVAFFTPLSVPLHELAPGLPFDLNLPTEPLLFAMFILFALKLAYHRGFDPAILKHPVSLALYAYLGWLLVTCFTSTMPLVSFKFWLAKLWFIASCYFLAIVLFRGEKQFYRFAGLYISALVVVIFYAWYRHVGYGLGNREAGHYVMNPFYTDHTSYGAMLAFFVPLLILVVFHRNFRLRHRSLAGVALVLFSLALVLSYTRAAWLSLLAAFGVWLIIRMKIRFRRLFISFVLLIGAVFVFQGQILQLLERNNQDSSADLAAHVSSMTNVTTDASNLERINRWSCAVRMFAEKPVFGWGPGTYMFQYAPFQLTKQRTIISTNSADAGNAHSEYLGPLAESGLLGLISILVLLGVVFTVALRAYTRTKSLEERLLLLSVILGLVTYFTHGFLNNFLDTDKAAVPVWGFMALVVMIDLRLRREGARQQEPTS